MKFPREKRESRTVVSPPPEALQRVDGGGPWGPTQFDLPDRSGSNSQTILIVVTHSAVLAEKFPVRYEMNGGRLLRA